MSETLWRIFTVAFSMGVGFFIGVFHCLWWVAHQELTPRKDRAEEFRKEREEAER